MAEGRMLKKVICESPRLAALKNDTHRLIYTWLIPHLDIEGRHSADPRILKSHVAPILDHVTHKIINAALNDMAVHNLITLYMIDGKQFLELQRFKKHQNLRENRERPSDIPAPSARTTPGQLPECYGITPIEGKLREEKLSSTRAREEKYHPVDNSEKPKQELSKEQKPKTEPKKLTESHGERWSDEQSNELDQILNEMKMRYGSQIHQHCYVFVQTYFNKGNPTAVLFCLKYLLTEKLKGKSINHPRAWLDAAFKDQEGKHNARENETRAEEFKKPGLMSFSQIMEEIERRKSHEALVTT